MPEQQQLVLLDIETSLATATPTPLVESFTPDGVTLWGVDYGGGCFHVAAATELAPDDPKKLKSYQKLTDDEFISLSFCRPGDYVVIEMAHATSRSVEQRFSKAQPFTHDKWMVFQANAHRKGVSVRLWPHGMTPKARNHFYAHVKEANRKTDAADAHSIALAATRYGFNRLQNFAPKKEGQWSPIEAWSFGQVEDMNNLLNEWRMDHDRERHKVFVEFKYVYQVRNYLFKLHDNPTVAHNCRRWIFSDDRIYHKAGSKANVPMSLWVALFDERWERRKFNGKPLGINSTMRYLLGNRPNHFRAGVARSNLWYHGFRSILTKSEEDKFLVPYDYESSSYQAFVAKKQSYRRAMKLALRAMAHYHMDIFAGSSP